MTLPSRTRIVVATGNRAKLREFQSFLGDGFEVLSLPEFGIDIDVVEDAATIEGNAQKKLTEYMMALRQQQRHQELLYVVADDTGLEIDALSGAPGPLTKRWIGGEATGDADLEAHCLKLLESYQSMEERSASFRTVLCLGSIQEGFLDMFEGVLSGSILRESAAEGVNVKDFPFRNLFYLKQYDKTMGELDALKGKINILMAREKALMQVKRYILDRGARTEA